MSGQPPQRVQALRGRVSIGPYGKGSKSERDAVYLQAPGQRLVLRRKQGPVFGDTELLALDGQLVECDGFIVGHTLLAERIQRLP